MIWIAVFLAPIVAPFVIGYAYGRNDFDFLAWEQEQEYKDTIGI